MSASTRTRSAQKRLNTEYFSTLPHQRDSKFSEMIDRRTAENGLVFFGAARLSLDRELFRYNVFKNIVLGLKTEKDCTELKSEELVSSIDNLPGRLEQSEIEILNSSNDPALMIVCGFERVRLSDYPSMSLESYTSTGRGTKPLYSSPVEELYETYEDFLMSIHSS